MTWNERVESRMTPRLRRKSPAFWGSSLGATTMSSVLLLFRMSRQKMLVERVRFGLEVVQELGKEDGDI